MDRGPPSGVRRSLDPRFTRVRAVGIETIRGTYLQRITGSIRESKGMRRKGEEFNCSPDVPYFFGYVGMGISPTAMDEASASGPNSTARMASRELIGKN